MNEAFEKILENIENLKLPFPDECHSYYGNTNKLLDATKEIVQEVAEEYKGGWISCSEMLPEESGEYLVTSKIYFVPDHVDEIDNYVGVKISHYSTRYGWLDDEVMAWQPLPEPYKESD